MKTNFILLFFFALFWQSAHCQHINFEHDSLDAVLLKAQRIRKPVFILISGPEISKEVPRQMREQMVGSGLDHPEVTETYNSQFVNFKAPYKSAVGIRLATRYNIRAFPTFLYLSSEGILIHRNHGNYSSPKRYLDDIKAFQDKQNSTHNLSYFGKEFEKGRRDVDFLRQYLQLHKEMGVEPATELLDAYASSLSEAGIMSFSELVFIYEFGPVVGSQAYVYARQKQTLIDSLYRTLPYGKRVEINNKVIGNTMRKAIETKDKQMAARGAGFARNTWSSDPARGQRIYLNNMLSFYRSTKDTASYIPSAIHYYNRYFMAIPQDSAAKMVVREKQLLQARRASGAAMADNVRDTGQHTETMVVTRFETVPSTYTMELNNAAYYIYQTGTNNKMALSNAADWSKRTVELDPTVAFYHTYAMLLYKLDDFKGAEVNIQTAIKLAKQNRTPTDWLQEELRKIKTRKL
ncbi:hypothetical protein [Pontibacter sp. HSC-36F09]|uniref:hypothetical protein n=1 Tax=Pontibacter sp. HSC-36F09 TaxID=2910966 RepID=UPI00209EC242|nr:hypothetical protein [Pontibacter sp. HSC-36F09]MCP2044948.1 hypothetical protein [Pontibacter sp. HSC-36F09]